MPDDFRPVSQWPRLLAGPMVRRVASNRAHIFVATKMACQAHVVLYSGRQSHSGPATAIASGTPVALERVGENLFISVLAVDIPASQTPRSTISYDVIINDGTSRGLFQLGLLGGSAATDPRRRAFPLGYDEGMLPSFVLPADDPEDLRIVHASCRKAHGGGSTEADALQLIDAAIGQSIEGTLPAANRPQQLILTGDQIYADDVAPGLLQALTGAGNELLGWTEELPLLNMFPALSFLVDPGWRTRYLSIRGVDLKDIPEDDAPDYSQSHLLRFGEWVAMYLFAWSDTLWSVDGNGDYFLPQHPRQLPVDEALAMADRILGAVDTLGLVAVPARVARGVQIANDIAAKLVEHRDRINTLWQETRPKVLRYAKSVRSIRRVLANCATYTMFDDHEITDDWYVSKRVHDQLKGNDRTEIKDDVGPRLLRNGLSAYAFFQHWGNEPEDFGAGAVGQKGRDLLEMWRFRGTSTGCTMKQTPNAGDTLLGIDRGDSPIPPNPAQRLHFVRMRWDYAVGFPAHRLIALDTRTWRAFPAGTPLSWTDLAPHIPNPRGVPANAGAVQLTAAANAWRQAGNNSTRIAMRHFADVIDDYVGFASATGDSFDQLKGRMRTFASHFHALLNTVRSHTASAGASFWDPLRMFFTLLLAPPGPGDPDPIDQVASTVEELRDLWLGSIHEIAEYDFGPLTADINAALEALADFVDTAWSGSVVGMVHSARRAVAHAGPELWTLFTTTATSHSAFATLNTALVAALGALDTLSRTTGLDDLGAAIFRNGDNRVAPGLIRNDILPHMVERPIGSVATNVPVTVFLSPAPMFGNRLVEVAQRLAVMKLIVAGEAGEEEMDFEPWSANIPSMIDFIEATRSLDCAVILSGDVHYAGSVVVRASVLSSGRDRSDTRSISTRFIQFTSSSARNSDDKTRTLGQLDDLLYDDHGTVFYRQADWTSLMDQGRSSVTHLRNLARAQIEEALGDLGDAVNLRHRYEDFRVWLEEWRNTDISVPDILHGLQRVLTAPENTIRSLATEAAWQIYASIELITEFADDPLLKIFGDFLSAPAPFRAALRNFYEFVELDPSNGLDLDESILTDFRSPRLSFTNYPAIHSRMSSDPAQARALEDQERRTVGHANAGFISFVKDEGVIKEAVHELRWYPHDAPARQIINHVLQDPIPRTDWYGSLHRAGWYPIVRDPARHGR